VSSLIIFQITADKKEVPLLSFLRHLRFCVPVCAIGVAILSAPSDALAKSKIKTLGRYGDWAGYTFQENGKPVCYAATAPVKSSGKVSKRGDVLFMVTHRPAVEDIGVVTAVAGYTFKQGSKASVKIGGRSFNFFTRDGTAWASGKDDKNVVSAMRRGRTMVIKGQTTRSTSTTDQYSLMGFTKAYQAISKACNIRVR
jgi:invasion protein IalB